MFALFIFLLAFLMLILLVCFVFVLLDGLCLMSHYPQMPFHITYRVSYRLSSSLDNMLSVICDVMRLFEGKVLLS